MVKLVSVSAVMLVASVTFAAPVPIIDGNGAAGPTYSVSDTNLTMEQTVGGLGAAIFDSLGDRNANAILSSSGTRPLLGDNSVLSAEIYVTALTVSDASQGENRIRVTFRNPVGGTQETQWMGTSGGAGGSGLQWFPTQVNTWTTFNYDLTQESWWTNDYSTWEIYRIYIYENDDPDYDNTFGIRNLQFTVPEPATTCLLGLGLLSMLRRRRR